METPEAGIHIGLAASCITEAVTASKVGGLLGGLDEAGGLLAPQGADAAPPFCLELNDSAAA